jgi:hypothetical protein
MDDWRIKRALSSVRQLNEHIDQLTGEEVHAALKFECETQRRATVVERLIAKAGEFARLNEVTNLKEKYKWHVPPLL